MKIIQKTAFLFLRTRVWLLSIISEKRAGNLAFKIFSTPYGKSGYSLSPFFGFAEPLTLHFNTLRIKGYRWNRGRGKRILVLHGFRSNVSGFEALIKKLAGQGYEVLAFDAPAHGKSDGSILTALDYKEFIAAVYTTFGPADHIIAHSFGALAACLYITEKKPERTRQLVLIAPASQTTNFAEQLLSVLQITKPGVIQQFYNNIESISGQSLSWFSIRRCLQDGMPASFLWVHDTKDMITPVAEAKEIEALAYTNLRFLYTNGLGHSRIYRDATVIQQVVAFLA